MGLVQMTQKEAQRSPEARALAQRLHRRSQGFKPSGNEEHLVEVLIGFSWVSSVTNGVSRTYSLTDTGRKAYGLT